MEFHVAARTSSLLGLCWYGLCIVFGKTAIESRIGTISGLPKGKPIRTSTMILFLQLAYATAVGFTAAGFASTIYAMYSGKKASLTQPVKTVQDGLRTVLLSALAGPWVLASATVSTKRSGSLSNAFFVAGISLSWFWGLCFGIILISVLEKLA